MNDAVEKTSGPVRWGILATGSIAEYFARDLALVDDCELTAVGSRDLRSARAFAARFGAGRAHRSYEDLAADPDVDVVYVATPHSRHFLDVMTCFEAGKGVLCEKPLTLNAADAATLVAESRARGLFLAEAMWTQANPNIRTMLDLVRDGAIGRPRQVRAQLGFCASPDRARLWDPQLGASATLDVGVYALAFAHLLLGEPADIVARGVLSDRGIDVNVSAILTYADGAVADLAWNQVAFSDNRASIAGDSGLIELYPRFNETTGFTWSRDGVTQRFEEPLLGEGYTHEIREVADCVRAGVAESDLLPLDATVAVLRQIDEILRQVGVLPR